MNKLNIWNITISPKLKHKIINNREGSLYAESCFYLFAKDRKYDEPLTAWEFFVKTHSTGEAISVGFLKVKTWKNELIDLVSIFL